jgi:hypothetical protein
LECAQDFEGIVTAAIIDEKESAIRPSLCKRVEVIGRESLSFIEAGNDDDNTDHLRPRGARMLLQKSALSNCLVPFAL